jgi:hypothetical protein
MSWDVGKRTWRFICQSLPLRITTDEVFSPTVVEIARHRLFPRGRTLLRERFVSCPVASSTRSRIIQAVG